MQDNNYITIQGWMINQLHLQGNALLVYALVYGFSQDGESDYHGNIQYICESLLIGRATAMRTLKALCESGLIKKEERRGTTAKYRVSQNDTRIKMIREGLKNDTGGGIKMIPDNNVEDKDIYKSNNTHIEKPSKKEIAPNVFLSDDELDKLITKYGNDATRVMIEKLSTHKGANGKKYKSDYLAILNWVVDWYTEQMQKAQRNSGKTSNGRPSKIEGNIRTLVELNQDYQIETDDIPF